MGKIKDIDVMTRVLGVLIVAALVSNPLSGQYILQGIIWVFDKVFMYGSYVMLALGAYVLFYAGVKYANMNRVKIPKKTAKTTAQNYIK